MPFYHAPISHDRQGIQSNTPQQTSSSDFVDIVGATITTKDLSEAGAYLGWASVLVQNTENNAVAEFRVTFNGVPVGNLAVITLRTKDQDVGYTFLADIDNVEPGTVIQLQYNTDKGALTIQEFALLMDGIPQSRVIE